MPIDGPTLLITVTLPAGATLASARRRLGLTAAEVDADYGLVPIDPARGTYALLVTEAAAERIRGTPGAGGPYANPRIEPYGPPE